ncbi:MAG: hypothetical protein A2293_15220 [Elusimicrobia bacterium RIFOXYB2_FULL_49_7]|nr:MAG: hypothetical protein A2293_15220 [Elusimicrobia bacterium RIFOXYB2_FULL_49_7]
MRKMTGFLLGVVLFGLTFSQQVQSTPETASITENSSSVATPPATGYDLSDKDGNGITDAFEIPGDLLGAGASTPDSVGQSGEVRTRSGHRNLHGEHGHELDRGESPHAH